MALALSAAAVTLYVATSCGRPTPFDYFGRLALALLDGRYWLDAAPPWLNELAPCGPGRYCVPYLPAPTVLVMPFLPFAASAQAQTLAASVYGGLSAGATYLVVRGLDAPRRLALLVTLLGSIGTTLWLSAADGRSWYYAHAVAVLFATLAVLAAIRGRSPLIVGALLGVAGLSRGPLLLAAPALVFLSARRRGEGAADTAVWMAIGLLPFLAIEIAYNLLRWGVPWESGYIRLTQENALLGPGGQFSLSSIPQHLHVMFLQLPELHLDSVFFVRPSPFGMSLLFVSPALLFAAGALRWWRVRPEVAPLAFAAALALLPDVLHTSTGFTQFGYRFSLDAQPFLLPLVAIGAGWRGRDWGRPSGWFALAVGLSILFSAYGVLIIVLLRVVAL